MQCRNMAEPCCGRGASGPDIALVQRWLGGLNVDGRYGTSTETAVRRFQREQGLKIDGHVGRDTWDALYRAWADKNGEGGDLARCYHAPRQPGRNREKRPAEIENPGAGTDHRWPLRCQHAGSGSGLAGSA